MIIQWSFIVLVYCYRVPKSRGRVSRIVLERILSRVLDFGFWGLGLCKIHGIKKLRTETRGLFGLSKISTARALSPAQTYNI